jgi:hypothetical protein
MEKDNLSEKLSKAPSMREPLANNSPKEEDVEKMAEERELYEMVSVKEHGLPTEPAICFINGEQLKYKWCTKDCTDLKVTHWLKRTFLAGYNAAKTTK